VLALTASLHISSNLCIANPSIEVTFSQFLNVENFIVNDAIFTGLSANANVTLAVLAIYVRIYR
jgi:hypothetical protein